MTLEAPGSAKKPDEPRLLSLSEDALGPDAHKGRLLFYSARDPLSSGGVGCAGCHPDGRDDGQVWHEVTFTTADGDHGNFVGIADDVPSEARRKGVARRTPMLAGRVSDHGPYGWRAESNDLPARMIAGFGLHRWGGVPKHEAENLEARSLYLAAFVRAGLTPPERLTRELSEEERRGKGLFSGPAECAGCHVPDTGYTNRAPYPLPERPTLADFDREIAPLGYKSPSLLFLEGRAPYFHDGSVASLPELLEKNNDRMGKTNFLTPSDRAALVAFLRTL